MGEWNPNWIEGLQLSDPYYRTRYGATFLGDGKTLMEKIPKASIDLILTSPPFALRRKKEYGNVDADAYVDWFKPFAEEFLRIIADKGSLVIDIGGSWNEGLPTRSLYQYELLTSLVKMGFHFCQDLYWFNPAKLPTPAEWVAVQRIRVKDAVDTVWWLSNSPFPKADNRRVLQEYSQSMRDLLENGYKPELRPSGHDISDKFQVDRGGSIPPNLLPFANTDSNSAYLRGCANKGIKPHPARFPRRLPEFFIDFLTTPGDIVLDPFAGSNVTGMVAESRKRRWLAFEVFEGYLEGSRFRFESLGQEAEAGDSARASSPS